MSDPVRLPQQLSTIIAQNIEVQVYVQRSLLTFSKWLQSGSLAFFPEYTNHGPKHVEQVLETCCSLITSQTWSYITPLDGAALTQAVLLHDCAMHLTEEGFCTLINNANCWPAISPFDSGGWNSLWEEFLGEASRFSGRQLIKLFGTPDPISRPCLNPLTWTKRDRLLIGEFIRRHHTRLAHAISRWGIPSSGGRSTMLHDSSLVNFDFLADISGLIARSHGLSLRPCVDYMRKKYDHRSYRGLHSVYLMGLLRLADYLQIQPERAPSSHLLFNKFESPISRHEWAVHAAVTNITLYSDDPEAIYIQASPSSVAALLRLQDWLRGIQEELDHTWAVLGETYGRVEDLREFGYKIRRVRSNIEDVDSLDLTKRYVPRRIAFDTAGPDLVKLLIAPLYGDDATIGIRELVQNAADACRERAVLEPDLRYLVEVVFEYNGNELIVRIQDNGIGMDENIVSEYFFKAGASFRQSDYWRTAFTDNEGKSVVSRSGRFGVGVLAAFLIGERVEVTTRRIGSAFGLKFQCELDDENVEVEKVDAPIGTHIKIVCGDRQRKIFKKIINHEKMDWGEEVYGLEFWFAEEPCVVISAIGVEKPAGQEGSSNSELWPASARPFVCPSEDLTPAKDWIDFEVPGLRRASWTFRRGNFSNQEVSNGHVICNGIKIIGNGYDRAYDLDYSKARILYKFPKPLLSIWDRDGNLALDLSRGSLLPRTPDFNDEMLRSIVGTLLRTVQGMRNRLPAIIDSWKGAQSILRKDLPPLTPENIDDFLQAEYWAISEEGICLLEPSLLSWLDVKRVVILFGVPGAALSEFCRKFSKLSKNTDGQYIVILIDSLHSTSREDMASTLRDMGMGLTTEGTGISRMLGAECLDPTAFVFEGELASAPAVSGSNYNWVRKLFESGKGNALKQATKQATGHSFDQQASTRLLKCLADVRRASSAATGEHYAAVELTIGKRARAATQGTENIVVSEWSKVIGKKFLKLY
jgi:molecular chaperone HtpG